MESADSHKVDHVATKVSGRESGPEQGSVRGLGNSKFESNSKEAHSVRGEELIQRRCHT